MSVCFDSSAGESILTKNLFLTIPIYFHYHIKNVKNLLISQRTSWLGDRLLALVCNSFGNILMLTAGCLQSLDFWPSLPQLKLIGFNSDFPSWLLYYFCLLYRRDILFHQRHNKHVVSGEVAWRFNIVSVESRLLTLCIFERWRVFH